MWTGRENKGWQVEFAKSLCFMSPEAPTLSFVTKSAYCLIFLESCPPTETAVS